MLRIALCDDETAQRESTQLLLSRYFLIKGTSSKVSAFSSGQDLLNAIAETGPFDLYILDIVMPELGGIELGLAIRQTDTEGSIIYLTSTAEFALDSYKTRAFNYLLKPVAENTLFPVLDDAFKLQQNRKETNIQVKTKDGLVLLCTDNILFAETERRAVRYYLRDGSFITSTTTTGSFKHAIEPLLKDKRFHLYGASFAVNLHFIQMVEKTGVQLSNGHKLTLPKAACATLRTHWSDYWLEGGAHCD